MATLNVIYKIAADISNLEANVSRATQVADRMDQRFTSLESSAKEFALSAAKSFAFGAVTEGLRRLVVESVNYADQLSNLNAKTKISLQGLQDLEAIATPASVSLNSMAQAVNTLYKNLDSPAGQNALRNMGIDYARIRDLAPDQLFIEIGKAINSIEDPIARANAKQALFGRTFDAVAASFDQDVDSIIKNTYRMSDEQIRALDHAGDIWDSWSLNVGRRLKGVLGELVAFQMRFDQVVSVIASPSKWREFQESFLDLPKLPKAPALPSGGVVPPIDLSTWDDVNKIIKESNATLEKRAPLLRKVATEQDRWNDLVRQFSGPAKGFETELAMMHFQMGQVADATLEADQRAIGYLGTLKQFADTQIPELPSRQIGTGMGTGPVPLPDQDIEEATTKTEKLLGYLGQVDTVLSGINAKWAQMATIAVRTTSGIITSLQKGDWLGAIVAGVSGLIGAFGTLFGVTEESQRVSPLRDEFFKMQGGLEKLNPLVFQLTGNLKLVQAVFDAKTVEQYNAAIANLQALLTDQKTAFNDLQAAVQRYGFTLEELGPALQRQELDKQAQQLFKDWQLLNSAGIDTTVIATRMADTINAYVQNAIKMGIEVPEAMRPMLQQMVQMGKLTDASGKAITNLEDAGISFTMSMSEGFKSLIEEVKKLTDLIARSLGLAIENIPDPDVTVHVQYDTKGGIPHEFPAPVPHLPGTVYDGGGPSGDIVQAARGGLITMNGIQRFAAGGRVLAFPSRGIGADTVPAMLTPGELVLNKSQQAGLGGSNVVFHPGSIVINAGHVATEHDLTKAITDSVLQGIEQGGQPFGKFRKLVRQAS